MFYPIGYSGATSSGVVHYNRRTINVSAKFEAVPSLETSVIDASALIADIGYKENGVYIKDNKPRTRERKEITEVDIQKENKIENMRKGLVADGNARLFLVAKTDLPTGKIQFTIHNTFDAFNPYISHETNAKLTTINYSPNDVNAESNIKTLTVPITPMPDGSGQATAILLAGDTFAGNRSLEDKKTINSDTINISSCVLDYNGVCSSSAIKNINLEEHKPPVVLVHGLWGSQSSWSRERNREHGVKYRLEEAGFDINFFNYDDSTISKLETNNKTFEKGFKVDGAKYSHLFNLLSPRPKLANYGPSMLMKNNKLGDALMTKAINTACATYLISGISCTRADLVVHSMGGLMTRQYIKNNMGYKTSSFNQGNIRRVITLGTPHYGSGLANFLLLDDKSIGGCQIPLHGNASIDLLTKPGMLIFGGRLSLVDGAIGDLAVPTKNGRLYLSYQDPLERDLYGEYGDFIRSINSTKQEIPIFAIRGDVGTILRQESTAINNSEDGCVDIGGQPGTGIEKFSNNLTRGLAKINFCSYDKIFAAFANEKGKAPAGDGTVPLPSALGSLDITPADFQGVSHTDLTMSDKIAKKVIELLLDGLDQFDKQVSIDKPFSSYQSEVKSDSYLVSFALAMLGISDAQADETPSITISTDKTTVKPGDSVTITAQVSGGLTSLLLTDGDEYAEELTSPPFSWTIPFPTDMSGQLMLKAHNIADDGTVVSSNELAINIVPDMSTLNSISFADSDTFVLYVGSFSQQELQGGFSDGVTRDLTLMAVGTAYSEKLVNADDSVVAGDSPVISISADGEVTALQPGEAEIVATNNGKTAIRRVKVLAVPTNAGSDPSNHAPVANMDTATTTVNTPITVNLLVNDTDSDNDPLSVESLDNPGNEGGLVVNNSDGFATYTPPADFLGTESFTYTVEDGRGGTDSTFAVIKVNPKDNGGGSTDGGSTDGGSTDGGSTDGGSTGGGSTGGGSTGGGGGGSFGDCKPNCVTALIGYPNAGNDERVRHNGTGTTPSSSQRLGKKHQDGSRPQATIATPAEDDGRGCFKRGIG